MTKETLQIEYYAKNIYGEELNYFVPGNFATGFTMLTGKKTFNTKDQRGIAAMLGTKVEWKQVLPPKGK